MPNVPNHVETPRSIAQLFDIRTDSFIEDIRLEVATCRAEHTCADEKEDAGGRDEEDVQCETRARGINYQSCA